MSVIMELFDNSAFDDSALDDSAAVEITPPSSDEVSELSGPLERLDRGS